MKKRLRSIWVFHLNTGACNGCDIEILNVLTPYFDAERLGVKLVGSPRHADVLLVTGPLTRQCYYSAKRTYEAMPPKPRIVVAIGACACSGGIFYDSYSVCHVDAKGEYPLKGGISNLLPVDMFIPGCPPTPAEILYGIAQLAGLMEKKRKQEYYREEDVRFRLEEGVICERIRLILREELRRIVGYFDREKVLDEFVNIVKKIGPEKVTAEKLKDAISEYLRSEPDSRVKFAMFFLTQEYMKLRGYYERPELVSR